ncbi:hypothetical protein HGRIS_001802 [Hohenbuehelia grisea]|uniref:Uncharacterized protein n=1 Tax=Hohenbuehelia grisea TaxID=104357 RepID=A0ABR3JIL4_9AGAR
MRPHKPSAMASTGCYMPSSAGSSMTISVRLVEVFWSNEFWLSFRTIFSVVALRLKRGSTGFEDRPFTLNTHYLSSYKDKFLAFYKACRQKNTNQALMDTIREYKPTPTEFYNKTTGKLETPMPTGIQKILSGLVDLGIIGVKPEDIAKLLPPDEMEAAIDIMAEVRAYFQVAYKRVTDNVPLTVDKALVFGLEKGLSELLPTRSWVMMASASVESSFRSDQISRSKGWSSGCGVSA